MITFFRTPLVAQFLKISSLKFFTSVVVVFISCFTLSVLLLTATSHAETITATQTSIVSSLSLSADDAVSIDIVPTNLETVYSNKSNLKITNTCNKGAIITLNTNKNHNNLERKGNDTFTKTIASIASRGNLANYNWGYSTDGTLYMPVPKKDDTPAKIYDSSVATAAGNPAKLELTYGLKTARNIPSGNYTTDLVYTAVIKPDCLSYNLKFDLDQGTAEAGRNYGDKRIDYGQKINLSEYAPTRAGYQFIGWTAISSSSGVAPVQYRGNETNVNVNPSNGETLTLKANWRSKFFMITKMQEMTTEICGSATVPYDNPTKYDTDGSKHGDSNYAPMVKLTDTRDNIVYNIARLGDGKCWMVQNLRIAGKTLTPADSDVTSNFTLTGSTIPFSIAGNNVTPTAFIDLGANTGYYNWFAATAGTGNRTHNVNKKDAPSSICPKNWRLPTGGNDGEYKTLYDHYGSSAKFTSIPPNFNKFGYIKTSSIMSKGVDGCYWTSTAFNSINAHYVYIRSFTTYANNQSNKNFGYSVRCIAR